jgi:hypothetical protein
MVISPNKALLFIFLLLFMKAIQLATPLLKEGSGTLLPESATDKELSRTRLSLLELMEYEGDSPMSRSQAKRLINRFDRFLEVVLDFEGVLFIGQAFADEIFRVFAKAHPSVYLNPVNCNDSVKKMILRASRP